MKELYPLIVASLVVIVTVLSYQLTLQQRKNDFLELDKRKYLDRIIQLQERMPILEDSLSYALVQYHPETLWLARGIYSETNLIEEMQYVGWVIRNRVEQNFRGESTYRGVVLDEYQFSAFNSDNKKRWYYINKSVTDENQVWLAALNTAIEIRLASSELRPIPKSTTHFYSEISMVPTWKIPKWVPHMELIPTPGVQEKRFRFYASDSLIETL